MCPFIEVCNISKQYQSNKQIIHALSNVSFDIREGEILALLGVNGSGKTTLSSIIATVHPPTAGEIRYQGKSIYKTLFAYRAVLGFCPQRPNLDNTLTLEQNLRFAGHYYGMSEEDITARIRELSVQLGLTEYLARTGGVLSGGYRQRFMIARCLMHRPRLVLLDEPTVGLDPHIRRQLWTIIKNLREQGVTVILTTHYLDEAEHLADRVCIIDKGMIKLVDTPEKLLEDFKKCNLEDVFLALMQEGENISRIVKFENSQKQR